MSISFRFQLCTEAEYDAAVRLPRRDARRRPLRAGTGRHELLRRAGRAWRGRRRRRRSGWRRRVAAVGAGAQRRPLRGDLRHAPRRGSRRRRRRARRRRRRARLRSAARPHARGARVRLVARASVRRRHRADRRRDDGRRGHLVRGRRRSRATRPTTSPSTRTARLFSGDLIFAGSVGRYDLAGGDWPTLLESARALAERYPPETTMYPGHGPPTTLGAELERNPYLAELRA